MPKARCESCRVKVYVPHRQCYATCPTATCPKYREELFPKLGPDSKYVKVLCKTTYYTQRIWNDWTFKCECCKRDVGVDSVPLEVKNGQKIYAAHSFKALINRRQSDLESLREQLKLAEAKEQSHKEKEQQLEEQNAQLQTTIQTQAETLAERDSLISTLRQEVEALKNNGGVVQSDQPAPPKDQAIIAALRKADEQVKQYRLAELEQIKTKQDAIKKDIRRPDSTDNIRNEAKERVKVVEEVRTKAMPSTSVAPRVQNAVVFSAKRAVSTPPGRLLPLPTVSRKRSSSKTVTRPNLDSDESKLPSKIHREKKKQQNSHSEGDRPVTESSGDPGGATTATVTPVSTKSERPVSVWRHRLRSGSRATKMVEAAEKETQPEEHVTVKADSMHMGADNGDIVIPNRRTQSSNPDLLNQNDQFDEKIGLRMDTQISKEKTPARVDNVEETGIDTGIDSGVCDEDVSMGDNLEMEEYGYFSDRLVIVEDEEEEPSDLVAKTVSSDDASQVVQNSTIENSPGSAVNLNGKCGRSKAGIDEDVREKTSRPVKEKDEISPARPIVETTGWKDAEGADVKTEAESSIEADPCSSLATSVEESRVKEEIGEILEEYGNEVLAMLAKLNKTTDAVKDERGCDMDIDDAEVEVTVKEEVEENEESEEKEDYGDEVVILETAADRDYCNNENGYGLLKDNLTQLVSDSTCEDPDVHGSEECDVTVVETEVNEEDFGDEAAILETREEVSVHQFTAEQNHTGPTDDGAEVPREPSIENPTDTTSNCDSDLGGAAINVADCLVHEHLADEASVHPIEPEAPPTVIENPVSLHCVNVQMTNKLNGEDELRITTQHLVHQKHWWTEEELGTFRARGITARVTKIHFYNLTDISWRVFHQTAAYLENLGVQSVDVIIFNNPGDVSPSFLSEFLQKFSVSGVFVRGKPAADTLLTLAHQRVYMFSYCGLIADDIIIRSREPILQLNPCRELLVPKAQASKETVETVIKTCIRDGNLMKRWVIGIDPEVITTRFFYALFSGSKCLPYTFRGELPKERPIAFFVRPPTATPGPEGHIPFILLPHVGKALMIWLAAPPRRDCPHVEVNECIQAHLPSILRPAGDK